MNVLAHLHLATIANSSLFGNTVADFVKGDPYTKFPQHIADGIMLHRRIDRLTDILPEVKQAKTLFLPAHQRVAPITLDIIWDHFLAKHWHDYNSNQSLADFNQTTRLIIEQDLALFPTDFTHFMQHLWQGQWLINYAQVDFIGKVLNGMVNRRPKLSLLRDTFSDFRCNYQQLNQLFQQLYPSLIQQVKNLC